MATIGSSYLSLVDKLKREDPDHQIASIIELLMEENEILQDIITVEGNLPTGHKTTVRSGLPAVVWRRLNYGVPPSKSTTAQVTDSCGMLEGFSEVDKDLADLNGNTAEFRASEDEGFLQSFNNTMATALFYGNTDDKPQEFNGLAPRYSEYQTTDNTLSSFNVVHGGGNSNANTSVWIVGWHENSVFTTYPKGSQAGFHFQDLGQDVLEDSAGGKYLGYRSHYKWDIGLVLRDWRQVARVANIDITALRGGTVDIEDLMIRAYYRIKNPSKGKFAIYCNREVQEALHKRAKDQANVNLTIETFEGKPVTMFLGMPIRRCDAILNTEANVPSA